MGAMIRGFLDNDSPFGRLMTKCGIIIGANMMFVLFSIPVVTMGASFVALYHVMLKMLRGDGTVNPVKQFWVGFKSNFKQATIYWVILLLLVILGYVDVTFCRQAGGILEYFQYAICVLGILAGIITLFLFPTMAAFADTLPHLIRNAIYFAIQKPLRLIVILFFNVFPMYLTYTDAQLQPLFAFVWCFFGFGAVAYLGACLVLPDFAVYLTPLDNFEEEVENEDGTAEGTAGFSEYQKSEHEILKEMERLDM
jgi:uncharacterized membrane protein YesL